MLPEEFKLEGFGSKLQEVYGVWLSYILKACPQLGLELDRGIPGLWTTFTPKALSLIPELLEQFRLQSATWFCMAINNSLSPRTALTESSYVYWTPIETDPETGEKNLTYGDPIAVVAHGDFYVLYISTDPLLWGATLLEDRNTLGPMLFTSYDLAKRFSYTVKFSPDVGEIPGVRKISGAEVWPLVVEGNQGAVVDCSFINHGKGVVIPASSKFLAYIYSRVKPEYHKE